MSSIIIALSSSVITIAITSFFSYHFKIKQELKIQAQEYKVEILRKVYTPLVKALIDMYDHDKINYPFPTIQDYETIKRIIYDNYDLADPELVNQFKLLSNEMEYEHPQSPYLIVFDKDMKFDHYVFSTFNYYRKNLGLPHEKIKM